MTNEPLASRMRPRTLDEFIGQDAVVGKGRLLRRAIEADQLSSVIFFGPPGTGKTTLARVIANSTRARFVMINAVLGGVKDIREAVAEAQEARQGLLAQKTILFVDEVHRFNKSQQDALLPWVEDGTVILVGATTENPYFEVNPALVSRSRLFRLEPLGAADLRRVIDQALTDPDRGYGKIRVEIDEPAAAHLVEVANGDARTLLNALELAVQTTPPVDGVVRIDLMVAEESIQRRAVLYDREGDAHFDTISAFIKSIRGSDPDAALYWLARMVYAGEDPRFVLRRLLILAGEDVGLADPQAMSVVTACAAAFDRVGMPEGRFHLAQATLYLSTAPKSNSTMGLFDALASVEAERASDVPAHLKDASRDKAMGHGAGYLYPHAYQDHWVAQQYLPTSHVGRVYWQPSDQGYEGRVRDVLAQRREAQLAAMVEASPEPFSTSPTDKATDKWLARAHGNVADRLMKVRELLIEVLAPERHHRVLDVDARSGLLTWELVRRTPEGIVWAQVNDPNDAQALAQVAERLPELRRPRIVHGDIGPAVREAGVRFERIAGRDALQTAEARERAAGWVRDHLADGGRAVFVDTLPRRAQRLSALVGADEATRAAEERVYAEQVPWDEGDLALVGAVELRRVEGTLLLTPPMIERWFAPTGSLGARIAAAGGDAVALAAAVRAHQGREVPWITTVAVTTAIAPVGRASVPAG